MTLLHSLLRGQEGKRREALLSPKPGDQLPSSHFKPCLYCQPIWTFLWFFRCVFTVLILQILLDQAGCHWDLSRKNWVGNTCQNTVIFNSKQSQTNDLLILKRFIQQPFVLRPQFSTDARQVSTESMSHL